MKTKTTNEVLTLDERNKAEYDKFVNPAPGTNPMKEDFFPLVESMSANVVATNSTQPQQRGGIRTGRKMMT